jgi:hypothetical protein
MKRINLIRSLIPLLLLAANCVLGQARSDQEKPCHVTLDESGTEVNEYGGSGEATVRTEPHGCSFSYHSEVDWVTVVQPPGTTAVIRYTVVANPSPRARSGSVLIADQQFTVSQAAGPLPGLAAGPSSLVWDLKANEPAPPAKAIRAGGDDPSLVCVAQIESLAAKWLSVGKSDAGPPNHFEVRVNLRGLGPGEYTSAVSISAPGARNTVTIPVRLIVRSPSGDVPGTPVQ